MMIIVGITKNSGIFQYLAIWSVKRVNADPWGILDQLWEVHGDQIIEMLRETSATQIVDEYQTGLEFDDDIEF